MPITALISDIALMPMIPFNARFVRALAPLFASAETL